MSAICKACQKEYREGRQCPDHDGEVVCITCCKRCRYYRSKEYGSPCSWYKYNKKVNYEVELKKLDLQIEAIRNKIRYYYERSWTQSAQKKEHEVEMLLRLKRRMMEERDNERKNQEFSNDSNPSGVRTNFHNAGAVDGTGRS